MAKTILQEMEEAEHARLIRLSEAAMPMLEPAAREAFVLDAASISLAISMKRIADFICGGKDSEGIDHMDVVAYIGREIADVLKSR